MSEMTIISDAEQIISEQMRDRRERLQLAISRYVMWGSALLVFFLVLAGIFSSQKVQLFTLAGFTAPLVFTSALYPTFYRRGRASLGIILFFITMILPVGLGTIIMPVIRLAATIGYFLIILLANMLLGDLRSRVLVGVCIFGFALDILAINLWKPDWLRPLDPQVEIVLNLLLSITAMVVAALLVRTVILDQQHSFETAQHAQMEIEKQALSEIRQKEYLQKTISSYVDSMGKIGQGNLSVRIPLHQNGNSADDPLLVLGMQMNETIANLQAMILSIQSAAKNLNETAAEILAATIQQVSSASEQSSVITQTTTTVNEVKTIAEQVSLRASETTEISQRTVEVALSGQASVQQSIESMQLIQERVKKIAENILALSDRTLQIGQIITTVSEIASQSNMLALNASIEAARAGDEGNGFAVVAKEVRDLSEQSQRATRQIKAILQEIQNATNTSVMATEEGIKGVDQGVTLAAQAQRAIEQLSGAISETAQVAMQLTAGGRQQVVGMEQIALAISGIHQASIQSLSSTRQTERAAQALNDLAGSLLENIGRYQV